MRRSRARSDHNDVDIAVVSHSIRGAGNKVVAQVLQLDTRLQMCWTSGGKDSHIVFSFIQKVGVFPDDIQPEASSGIPIIIRYQGVPGRHPCRKEVGFCRGMCVYSGNFV